MAHALWRAASPLLTTLALLSTACKIGPHYSQPPAPTPADYKEIGGTADDKWKTATPRDGELRGKWWELFNDPRLNELEEKVSISNQSVKQAEAQFRQARALIALNHAGYYPTISTGPAISTGQSSGTLRSVGGAASAGSAVFSTFALPVSASWEPDLWGRVRLSVENSSALAQASAGQLENLRLSLQAELASDYFSLLGTDMLTKLLNDTIAAYEKTLQLTTNRYLGGVASKADVEQARTQLETTRASAIDLQATRAQFEHAIAVLAGEPPSGLTIEPAAIAGPPPPIPVGLPSQLLERRPDIAAAERQIAAANAEVGIAETAYYPTLTLSAGGGLQSGSLVNLFMWPSRFWSVGPGLAMTLFDFGRRRAQVRITEAAYDAMVANYRQTALNAFQAVEDQLSDLHYLANEADQQQIAVNSAEESLRLETDRYKGGTVSYIDVITSQAIALADERAAVSILERRMIAAVNLIRALGGGWSTAELPTPDSLRSSNATGK